MSRDSLISRQNKEAEFVSQNNLDTWSHKVQGTPIKPLLAPCATSPGPRQVCVTLRGDKSVLEAQGNLFLCSGLAKRKNPRIV